jgi:ABC-type multidrug transport system ATPase subunit
MTLGSVLQIGHYTFVLQANALTIADRGDNIRLDVDRITKVVKLNDRLCLCLLNNVNLAIELGQFVALAGGSGAGKSTLMQTLLGIQQPTAGLDPGLDKKMMQLLRRLADEGRTVVLVTHATSNINLCDRVAFMGIGGNLCYFYPPAANDFFEVPSEGFADIYIKLETPDNCLDTATRFQASEYYQTYIKERLSLPTHGAQLNSTRSSVPPPERVKQSFFQQIQLLTRRYIQLLRKGSPQIYQMPTC